MSGVSPQNRWIFYIYSFPIFSFFINLLAKSHSYILLPDGHGLRDNWCFPRLFTRSHAPISRSCQPPGLRTFLLCSVVLCTIWVCTLTADICIGTGPKTAVNWRLCFDSHVISAHKHECCKGVAWQTGGRAQIWIQLRPNGQVQSVYNEAWTPRHRGIDSLMG